MENPTVESLNAMFELAFPPAVFTHPSNGRFVVNNLDWTYILEPYETLNNVYLSGLIAMAQQYDYLFYLESRSNSIRFNAFPRMVLS